MFIHVIAIVATGLFALLPPPPLLDSGAELDVDKVAELVLAVDPGDLVDSLESRFRTGDVAEGFVQPPRGETSEMEENLGPIEMGPGSTQQVGEVVFYFDGDPEVVPGIFSGGAINYVVLDEEIRESDVNLYRAALEASLDDDPPEGVEEFSGAVEEVDFHGATAIDWQMVFSDGGIVVTFDILMVPVGNVMLFGTFVTSGLDEVDGDIVREWSDGLVVSGVRHLERVATGLD